MSKNDKIILLLAFILIAIDLLTCVFLRLEPQIVLKGPNPFYINFNDKFQEPGYYASLLGENLTNKVEIKNNIKTDKLGTYYIKYRVKALYTEKTILRKVIVKDLEPPKIILKGDTNIKCCPNKEFVDPGYEATDNYDGDLTNKVKVKTNDSIVLYQVSDKAGNLVKIERKITKIDDTPPTINLRGNQELIWYFGNKYIDPGYEAHDNCDDNLTDKVKIDGEVNINKVGEYNLTYQVSDSAGNNYSIKRVVKVVSPDYNKIIYLTFDDGPSSSITPGILKILKEENVKATFFVIGSNSSLDYLIRQAYSEGHTIGLHSYTHNYNKIYASEEAYFNDLNAIENRVYQITGIHPKIIRFPGGSSNTVSRFNPGIMSRLSNQVLQKGYHYFDWNVSSGDAGDVNSAEAVYNMVIKNLKRGNNIILMHDSENNYKTLNALRDIIRYGKNNGYSFSAINMNTPMIHHHINN